MLREYLEFDVGKSTLEKLSDSALDELDVKLFVKRDDLIHPIVSGNKWRKLKYNIQACLDQKNDRIITFGGAFSNHLIATAYACKSAGIKAIGIVRGEELSGESNQTLKDCKALGMDLKFIAREKYLERYESQFHEELKLEYPSSYIVPEGGANYLGMIGCQEIAKELKDFDEIFVAQGTATTSCGILMGLNPEQRIHVVPALKGFDSLFEMKNLLSWSGFDEDYMEEKLRQVVPHDEYHFGGYAKTNADLLSFMQEIKIKFDLDLDGVYTAKCMFALMDQIKKKALKNKKVVFIHTGGLQGNRSLIT